MLLVFLLVFINEDNNMDGIDLLRVLRQTYFNSLLFNQHIKILKIPVDSRRQVETLIGFGFSDKMVIS